MASIDYIAFVSLTTGICLLVVSLQTLLVKVLIPYWRKGRELRALTRRGRPHHGVYGDPSLSYWFGRRQAETDPELRRLPLRDYIKRKTGYSK